MMAKFLICGGNGLLGSWWRQHKCVQNNVFCLSESKDHNPLSNTIVASKSDADQLAKLFERNKVNYVINCVALANVDQCEKDKDLAYFLNAQFPRVLATASKSVGAKIVHISTDHLYGGLSHSTLIKESMPPSTCNHYAETKLAGEEYIQEITDNHLILRTNFFGKSMSSKPSYSDWLRDSLQQGREINIPSGIYFNPVHYTTLIELSHKLMQKRATGVFNISCDSFIEKVDFAMSIAKVYGLNKSLIKSFREYQAANVSPKRPNWMCLDNSKVSSVLGVKIGDYTKQISHLL